MPTVIEIIKSSIRTMFLNKYRRWRFERNVWRENRIAMIEEAQNADSTEFVKYIGDLDKFHVSFQEWKYLYDFPNLTEEAKYKFLSRYDAQKLYRSFVDLRVREVFRNKALFLDSFPDLIKRRFLKPQSCLTNQYVETLMSILDSSDIIAKPLNGSLGIGVRKIKKGSISNYKSLANEFILNRTLVEECVCGKELIQGYNYSSLNTIRIITCFDGLTYSVFASFIRFGRNGSIVDNAHNGGLWCHINIKDGFIDSEAVDSMGMSYEKHPDSRKIFMNFKIPMWSEMCKICLEAHKKVLIPFIGWDVCLDKNDEIQIIEGNHAPDVDVLQFPKRIGLREEFTRIILSYEKYLKNNDLYKELKLMGL